MADTKTVCRAGRILRVKSASRPRPRPILSGNIMNQHIRREIFERFRAANPHPTTELQYNNPFELLIAVLLSAQATDAGVNKATAKLFPVAGTPQAMLDLGLEGVMEYTRTIGLYKTKSKHIIETCRILLHQH